MYPTLEELTQNEKHIIEILLKDFIKEDRKLQGCYLYKKEVKLLESFDIVEQVHNGNDYYYRLTRRGAIYCAVMLNDFDKNEFFDRFDNIFTL